MIPKPGFLNFPSLLVLAFLFACSSHQFPAQDYSEFVHSRTRLATAPIVEMYGRCAANISGRKVSSRYSLLLDPGNRTYIEITDPSQALLYAISLDRKQISLLFAQQQQYIQEPATAENLNAILGIPLLPDDALQLIAGYGINFTSWERVEDRKDGWSLLRSPWKAELTVKEHISRIHFQTSESSTLQVKYEGYRVVDNQSLPGKIRFEIPGSKLKINLDIDKYIPRDEASSRDMFALQLPQNAERLHLKDVYQGKPLFLPQ